MTRTIFILILSLMLLSCSTPETAGPQGEKFLTVVSEENDNEEGITYEVVFEKENDLSIKKKSSFFDSVKSDFFTEYQISPDDELDVFLSTKVWEKQADYDVVTGDTLFIKFPNAPKYDVSPKIISDRTILLPFVGKYQISAKTTLEIQQNLIKVYSKIFKKPEVKVSLPEYLTEIRKLKNELHSPSRGLRRLVSVRSDGYTVFPLLGEYKVSGKTLNEVTKEINIEYLKINPMLQADLFLK